ncbi:hypothetical protein BD779DRAFT_1451455, partial [Infundibulicybe gibba]
MTDYASQGKTRVFNVVDLNNCYTHQSYYTALSRSASAAGTIILQGFDTRKITGGASGALRQEFRDLEILDEISKLTYDGLLPQSVQGDRRNLLIASYREVKGESYIPPFAHSAIHWSKIDPYVVVNIDTGMLEPTISNLPDKASAPTKRVVSASAVQGVETAKRIKSSRDGDMPQSQGGNEPRGTQWKDNSCAYDVIVTIFYNVWNDDSRSWMGWFNSLNEGCLGALANGLKGYQQGRYNL